MNDEIRFHLLPVVTENITATTVVKFPPYNTSWHAVELNYTKGEFSIQVDYRNKQSKFFSLTFEMGDKVIIGSGKSNAGKSQRSLKKLQKKRRQIFPCSSFFPSLRLFRFSGVHA